MRFQFKKEWVIPTGIGIASFGIGGIGGYILGIRKTEAKVVTTEQKLEELRSEQLEFEYKRADENKTFNHMIQEAAYILRELKDEGRTLLDSRIEPEEMEISVEKHPSKKKDISLIIQSNVDDDEPPVNIYAEADKDWDYTTEIANRTPDHPYIIHVDEFYAAETEYGHTSITFYEGDGVLTDELDVPIYNPEKIVGRIEFGHGSRDPNICYVRNDRLEADYEVLRDPGSFSVEVLGEKEEDDLNSGDLKHSVYKFRAD